MRREKETSEEAEELDSLNRELNLSNKEPLMELIRFKKKCLEKTKYHQTQRPIVDKSHETKTIPAQVKREVYERSPKKMRKVPKSVPVGDSSPETSKSWRSA